MNVKTLLVLGGAAALIYLVLKSKKKQQPRPSYETMPNVFGQRFTVVGDTSKQVYVSRGPGPEQIDRGTALYTNPN